MTPAIPADLPPVVQVTKCPDRATELVTGCYNFDAPLHCVMHESQAPAPACQVLYRDIDDAILNAPLHETILIPARSDTTGRAFWPPVEVDRSVCLKGWDKAPPVITETGTSLSRYVVKVDAPDACVANLRIIRRTPGFGGIGAWKDSIVVVGNQVDVLGTGNGIGLSGDDIEIVGNVVMGPQAANFSGITYGASAGQRNLIAGNKVSGFDFGIRLDASTSQYADLGRVHGNAIGDCVYGIQCFSLTGSRSDGLAITSNRISNGVPGPADPSKGIEVTDLLRTRIEDNWITGVERGVHLRYHADCSFVRGNSIQAEATAIHVCPTDGNLFVKNRLITTGASGTAGFDFTNIDPDPNHQGKMHRAHVIMGGSIINADCGIEACSFSNVTENPPPSLFNVAVHCCN